MQRKILGSLLTSILLLVSLFFSLFFFERLGWIQASTAGLYFFIALLLAAIDFFLSSRIPQWLRDLKNKSQN